jgi:hypothetical protein
MRSRWPRSQRFPTSSAYHAGSSSSSPRRSAAHQRPSPGPVSSHAPPRRRSTRATVCPCGGSLPRIGRYWASFPQRSTRADRGTALGAWRRHRRVACLRADLQTGAHLDSGRCSACRDYDDGVFAGSSGSKPASNSSRSETPSPSVSGLSELVPSTDSWLFVSPSPSWSANPVPEGRG